MHDFEKRMIAAQLCELRAAENDKGSPIIAGYAAVFSTRSDLLGGFFVEEIAPGAFDDVMDQDVRGLFNHDPNYLLGRSKTGTLRLSLDSRGLAYEISPPDTQTIRDLVLTPLSRGDMSGSSFGFRVAPGGDTWREEDGVAIRTIYRLESLRDVGPVSFPAYPDAASAQRSLDVWKQAKGEGLHLSAITEKRSRERFLDLINAPLGKP